MRLLVNVLTGFGVFFLLQDWMVMAILCGLLAQCVMLGIIASHGEKPC